MISQKITLAINNPIKTLRFLFKYLNKKSNLFFHPPDKILTRLIKKDENTNQNQSIINQIEIENDLVDSISIYENIISVPLEKIEDSNFYYGGLINEKYKLIKEAIHFDAGHSIQKLSTSFDTQKIFNQSIPEIEDAVVFGGILFNHFGHFLLDSLARLWAYKFVEKLNPYIFFYAPWGKPNYLEKNNYVNQILTGFGIPHEKIVFIDRLIKFKKIIVPHQKYGSDYTENPDSIFLDFVRDFKIKNDLPKEFEKADKIYVSRSKMPITSGRIIAESLFEEYLISNGYKILYPERYNLFQQLTIYNNAKKIIFCSGSALHACILLPNLSADVAIIARWKDPNDNLYLTKQFRGYGKSVLGIDALRGQYCFSTHSSDYAYVDALSDVDWYKASIFLERQGFVDTLFNNFNELDYSNIVRGELQEYMQKKFLYIQSPKFIDFIMAKCKE